ncbi:MAG: glycosyltransferase, partial [Candidatus Aenigmatarchaeota archaeon]
MKICIISKYPPIEGGVSSGIYWLAKGLGEVGHEVFVVSNCWEVEETFREVIQEEESGKLEPKNVHLFSTQNDRPRSPPIPYLNSYVTKIASLSIDVIRKHDPDVIYSEYLLPYGVSALIAKHVTKKPMIVRHAGSDITTLFDSPFLRTAFIEVFKFSDKAMIRGDKIGMLSELGMERDRFVSLRRSVDTKAFNPNAKPYDFSKYKVSESPVFTYFGKLDRMKRCS